MHCRFKHFLRPLSPSQSAGVRVIIQKGEQNLLGGQFTGLNHAPATPSDEQSPAENAR